MAESESPIRRVSRVNGLCGTAPVSRTQAFEIEGRPWPVLFCFDPGARGWSPVARFSAAVAGFKDAARVEQEPAFAALRQDPGYQAVVSGMK